MEHLHELFTFILHMMVGHSDEMINWAEYDDTTGTI